MLNLGKPGLCSYLEPVKKNNPKILRAWSMYDWANSVYSLVITSTIFPVYFSQTARLSADTDQVKVLGFTLSNSVVFSYTLSAAFLITGLLSPLLTSLADHSGKKKRYLQFFCYLGGFSCAGLYFFTAETIGFSILLFLLATIGFAGSLVFYNSYLPDIATEERFDEVSAQGFAYGYAGSVLLLIANLLPILKPEWFGNISAGMASRISFLCTGIWWIGFAQITFRYLPNPKPQNDESVGNFFSHGWAKLKHTSLQVGEIRYLQRFLIAFFLFSTGVQTVMYLATLFGEKELKLDSGKLIATILLLQIVAIGGAKGFSWLSGRLGNTYTLAIAVVVWTLVCLWAYFVKSENGFFTLAGVVGIIMGGTQSLARSTYSKLIPDNTPDSASFFSFYDLVEKLSIVLGTFVYGLIELLTGNMRLSALGLMVFFVAGLLVLLRIPSQKVYVSETLE
jgi:UMF1 family MFS transporter